MTVMHVFCLSHMTIMQYVTTQSDKNTANSQSLSCMIITQRVTTQRAKHTVNQQRHEVEYQASDGLAG